MSKTIASVGRSGHKTLVVAARVRTTTTIAGNQRRGLCQLPLLSFCWIGECTGMPSVAFQSAVIDLFGGSACTPPDANLPYWFLQEPRLILVQQLKRKQQ